MKYLRDRFHYTIAISALFWMGTGLQNSARSGEINDFPLLKKNFPNMIEIEGGRNRSISFCPDNTCEMLVFSSHVPRQLAEEYAFIYLFSVSEYWLLDDWRKKPGVPELVANAVRAVPAANCQGESLMVKSKCIVRQMSDSKKLRVLSVRYDEGARVVSKQNELDHLK